MFHVRLNRFTFICSLNSEWWSGWTKGESGQRHTHTHTNTAFVRLFNLKCNIVCCQKLFNLVKSQSTLLLIFDQFSFNVSTTTGYLAIPIAHHSTISIIYIYCIETFIIIAGDISILYVEFLPFM